MKTYEFSGKTYEEAVENAKLSLQLLENELIIKEKSRKESLFNKKVVIEVSVKNEIYDFIKEYIKDLINNMGISANFEFKKINDSLNITIYSDNNAILIGKNGKNMDSLNVIIRQAIISEIGEHVKFNLDINDYKEKQHNNIIREAKRIAREVGKSKIEAKLDPMNSFERRLIHEALKDNKYVYTESIGEEPNRCLVIKPKSE